MLEVLCEALFNLEPLTLAKYSNLLAKVIRPLFVAFLDQGAFYYSWTTNFEVLLTFSYILH